MITKELSRIAKDIDQMWQALNISAKLNIDYRERSMNIVIYVVMEFANESIYSYRQEY